MKRRSFSLPLFSYFLSRIMLKWKQKEGKQKVKPVELSLDSYRHISPAFCIPPVNAISSKIPLSLSHSVSFSLSVLLSPSLSEGLSGWVTWAYVLPTPPRADWCAPAKKLALALPLSITQPKQFPKNSPYFPLSLTLSHSLTPLLVPAKTLTEISHRVQRRHQVKLKID